MTKAIYFDMDGTIAELYEVENWLSQLRAEDPTPYAIAKPKVDLNELADILGELKNSGWVVGIITWLSMDSSERYKQATRKAKAEWLKQIPFQFDEVHMVRYGAPKHRIAKLRKGVLVDDNRKVREQWEKYGGTAIDAEPASWIHELRTLN